MEEQRKHDGIDPQKNPAQLPVTDPDSRILPNKEGGYAPNYTPMAVCETTHGFIVGADVRIGNVEHLVLTEMIEGVVEDYGETPAAVMGDAAYSTGPNLTEMETRGIEFLSPLAREKQPDNPAERADLTQAVAAEDVARLPLNPQTKCFDKQAFIYQEEEDCYYCPAGKRLTRDGTETVQRSGMQIEVVRYCGRECRGCPLGARCRRTRTAGTDGKSSGMHMKRSVAGTGAHATAGGSGTLPNASAHRRNTVCRPQGCVGPASLPVTRDRGSPARVAMGVYGVQCEKAPEPLGHTARQAPGDAVGVGRMRDLGSALCTKSRCW